MLVNNEMGSDAGVAGALVVYGLSDILLCDRSKSHAPETPLGLPYQAYRTFRDLMLGASTKLLRYWVCLGNRIAGIAILASLVILRGASAFSPGGSLVDENAHLMPPIRNHPP